MSARQRNAGAAARRLVVLGCDLERRPRALVLRWSWPAHQVGPPAHLKKKKMSCECEHTGAVSLCERNTPPVARAAICGRRGGRPPKQPPPRPPASPPPTSTSSAASQVAPPPPRAFGAVRGTVMDALVFPDDAQGERHRARRPALPRSASAGLRWRTRRFRGSRRRWRPRRAASRSTRRRSRASRRGEASALAWDLWRPASGAASPPPATPRANGGGGGGRAPPHARVGPRVARVRDRAARRGRPPHRRARAAGAHRRARGPHELGVWQAVQVFGGRRHVCEQLREEEGAMSY